MSPKRAGRIERLIEEERARFTPNVRWLCPHCSTWCLAQNRVEHVKTFHRARLRQLLDAGGWPPPE